jgi:hypothetical protein
VHEPTETTGAVISRIPRPVNLEPGISGAIGEARHQAEVVAGGVKNLTEILSPEALQDAMKALLSRRITLTDFVALLPKQGAAQFKLPTVFGRHRIIDHVFQDGTKVVFRESKNYEDVFGLTEKTMTQLMADLGYLKTFGEVRIEWRISSKTLDAATAAELDDVVADFPGLFSYVLD